MNRDMTFYFTTEQIAEQKDFIANPHKYPIGFEGTFEKVMQFLKDSGK